jgi:hypothetical protein
MIGLRAQRGCALQMSSRDAAAAAAAAAAALARPDAPVRRGSLANSILGVAAGVGGAIARVGGAAAAVIADADLRRQVSSAASLRCQSKQKAASQPTNQPTNHSQLSK